MPGELLQQPGQLRERLRRGQLMEIIDDQEDAVAMLSELRAHSVGDGLLVEIGCRCQLSASARRAGGPPNGAEDGEPELLGVLLFALHLDDCQSVRLTRPVRPGPQQRGLAAACGARDKRYLGVRRAIEGCEKVPALNQPRSCRTRLSLICPSYHARTRSQRASLPPSASQHPVHVTCQ